MGLLDLIVLQLQDENAPFPHVYEELGWHIPKYLVTVGALCGLLSSLLGAMFPLLRFIYAMSSDGLLFQSLGRVHPRFQTPSWGMLLAGTFTGVAGLLSRCEERLGNGEPLVVIPFAIFSICVIVTLIIISLQPKSSMKISFTVPLVPWLAGISILINIYLMTARWCYMGSLYRLDMFRSADIS